MITEQIKETQTAIKFHLDDQNTNRDIYFISDAHIGSWDKESEAQKEKYLQQFCQYLITISPPPLLYIIGDLFDFWFEYRFAIPSVYQRLLTQLVVLRNHGVNIRYVTGNHDFWMRDFFPTYFGIDIYRGIHIVRLGMKSFYIFHGDGVLKEDQGYQLLKRVLQNPILIKAYQWLHPDIGIPIARWASAMSRSHYQKDAEIERQDDEKYWAYAFEKLNLGYDYVLMGHTHRPVAITLGEKVYINLGDWISHFTFVRFDGHLLNLYQWNGNNNSTAIEKFTEITKIQMETPATIAE